MLDQVTMAVTDELSTFLIEVNCLRTASLRNTLNLRHTADHHGAIPLC